MVPMFMLLCLWGLLLMNNTYGHETLGTGEYRRQERSVSKKRRARSFPPISPSVTKKGRKVKLGDFLGKPAILVIVYYTCEHVCPQMLGGLSQALPRLALMPGKDYRVITVSIDAVIPRRLPGIGKEKLYQGIGPSTGPGQDLPGRRMEISDRAEGEHSRSDRGRGFQLTGKTSTASPTRWS